MERAVKRGIKIELGDQLSSRQDLAARQTDRQRPDNKAAADKQLDWREREREKIMPILV